MTYQAKRTSEYTQDFEMVDESGRVVHSIKVALDPSSMVEKLSRQFVDLLKIREKVCDMQSDGANYYELKKAYEELGNSVIVILKSVFGDEDTKTILEFYRDRYNDIIQEVMPFIANVVIPDVRRISQQNRKNNLQKYNRKQRRTIGKMAKKLWDI